MKTKQKPQAPLIQIGSTVMAGAYAGTVTAVDNGTVEVTLDNGHVTHVAFAVMERSLDYHDDSGL